MWFPRAVVAGQNELEEQNEEKKETQEERRRRRKRRKKKKDEGDEEEEEVEEGAQCPSPPVPQNQLDIDARPCRSPRSNARRQWRLGCPLNFPRAAGLAKKLRCKVGPLVGWGACSLLEPFALLSTDVQWTSNGRPLDVHWTPIGCALFTQAMCGVVADPARRPRQGGATAQVLTLPIAKGNADHTRFICHA